MIAIYNVLVYAVYGLLKLINFLRLTQLMSSESKLRKFIEGQSKAIECIATANISGNDNVVWFHAASLGEYGIARPIIRRLIEEEHYRVVMTFFSSTGYEALHPRVGKDPYAPDYVFYLPLDTPGNASRFLDLVRPKKAVFMVSEIWPNYLHSLHRRGIKSCLVSAKVSKRTAAMKWYGGLHRSAMQCFNKILVLDELSQEMLQNAGMADVEKTGNPLFDNVIGVAEQPYENPILERFCQGHRVFIAGSISDDNDLQLTATLANRHGEMRFVFVPHEITTDNLCQTRSALIGKSVLYSECNGETDFDDEGIQVLIFDRLGELSRLYRYGAYAYIGGGFTRYLHSLIEASVYGLPVSFGPYTGRKVTPQQIVSLGIGRKVSTPDELDLWITDIKDNAETLQAIRRKAIDYVYANAGATQQVTEIIRNL